MVWSITATSTLYVLNYVQSTLDNSINSTSGAGVIWSMTGATVTLTNLNVAIDIGKYGVNGST
jgi:hypothetical protein